MHRSLFLILPVIMTLTQWLRSVICAVVELGLAIAFFGDLCQLLIFEALLDVG